MGSNPTPSAIQKARALQRSGGLWLFEFWRFGLERSLSFAALRLCSLASPFYVRLRAAAVSAPRRNAADENRAKRAPRTDHSEAEINPTPPPAVPGGCACSGDLIETFPGEVSRNDDTVAIIAEPREKWGRLDILVNPAAITARNVGERASLEERRDKVMAVNVKGSMVTADAVWPLSAARLANPIKEASRLFSVINQQKLLNTLPSCVILSQVPEVSPQDTVFGASSIFRGIDCLPYE